MMTPGATYLHPTSTTASSKCIYLSVGSSDLRPPVVWSFVPCSTWFSTRQKLAVDYKWLPVSKVANSKRSPSKRP